MSLFGDDDEEKDLTPERGGGAESLEAPALEGLPEPRQARECFGHEAVERDLLGRWESGRFPHALIFSGLEGIGKATMAFRLARYLLKKDEGQEALFGAGSGAPDLGLFVSPDDPVFARVASGGHPDLLTVERQFDEKNERRKAALDVEQVRRIAPFLRMTASGGGWRVVIVDDADTMNRNAQNAILKILEEPPPRSLIILIAHRAGSLLPTIRSRAQLVPFHPLSKESVSRLLAQAHPDMEREDLEILTDLAEGSIGAALRMAEEGGGALIRQICAPLARQTRSPWKDIHNLAARISGKDQEAAWRLFAAVVPNLTQRLAITMARGAEFPASLAACGLKEWASGRNIKEVLEISGDLQHTLGRALAANLDRNTAILSVFSILLNGRKETGRPYG